MARGLHAVAATVGAGILVFSLTGCGEKSGGHAAPPITLQSQDPGCPAPLAGPILAKDACRDVVEIGPGQALTLRIFTASGAARTGGGMSALYGQIDSEGRYTAPEERLPMGQDEIWIKDADGVPEYVISVQIKGSEATGKEGLGEHALAADRTHYASYSPEIGPQPLQELQPAPFVQIAAQSGHRLPIRSTFPDGVSKPESLWVASVEPIEVGRQCGLNQRPEPGTPAGDWVKVAGPWTSMSLGDPKIRKLPAPVNEAMESISWISEPRHRRRYTDVYDCRSGECRYANTEVFTQMGSFNWAFQPDRLNGQDTAVALGYEVGKPQWAGPPYQPECRLMAD